jgi:hypothetical protein
MIRSTRAAPSIPFTGETLRHAYAGGSILSAVGIVEFELDRSCSRGALRSLLAGGMRFVTQTC